MMQHEAAEPQRPLPLQREMDWEDTYLPVLGLQIDDRYQRSVNAARVLRIAERFTARLCGAIDVNARPDGGYWVMDGGHRAAAAKQAGHSVIAARLFHFSTIAEEAMFFVDRNMESRTVSPLHRLKARLCANDAEAVALVELLREYGYVFDYSNAGRPGSTAAAWILERLHSRDPEGLRWVLFIASAAWGDARGALNQTAIGGLYYVRQGYRAKLKDDRLLTKLRSVDPALLRQRAFASEKLMPGLSAEKRLGEMIVAMYDERLRAGRLRDRPLYDLDLGGSGNGRDDNA